MKILNEKENFEKAIVDELFPTLSHDVKVQITALFDHAFNHPWCDDDLRASIVSNICLEHGILVPEKYNEG